VAKLDSTGEETTLYLPRHENRYMKSDNCESVDGVYTRGDNLVYLFQITIAKENPVKANGFIKQLKDLKVFEGLM
jgi:hypothetical protein